MVKEYYLPPKEIVENPTDLETVKKLCAHSRFARPTDMRLSQLAKRLDREDAKEILELLEKGYMVGVNS